MKKGMVLNIQRFSIHDGPGIRTLVFMKGCPLRCPWCSNPESQKGTVELSYIRTRCVACGKCAGACPCGAIRISEDGAPSTDREACESCGSCVEVCSYEAREIAGELFDINRLLKEVEKDREFYANSGGGVTVGGGEPAQQHDFVREFLKRCTERWLHTALETCGHAPWEHLEGILKYVDFLFYDVKHMDPGVHKRMTGVSNELILNNLGKIASKRSGPEVVVRIPVIPGLNDSKENVTATAKYMAESGGVKGIELLPYHRLGMSKYEQFGMEYKMMETTPPGSEHMKKLQRVLESFGMALGQN